MEWVHRPHGPVWDQRPFGQEREERRFGYQWNLWLFGNVWVQRDRNFWGIRGIWNFRIQRHKWTFGDIRNIGIFGNIQRGLGVFWCVWHVGSVRHIRILWDFRVFRCHRSFWLFGDSGYRHT